MPKNNFIARIFTRYGTFLILLLLIIGLQILYSNVKLISWVNIQNILIQSTVLAIASLGLAFVMISGEMDLSMGGTIGLVAACFAGALTNGVQPQWAALFAIGISILFGVLNGYLVTKWRFSSFLVTVATYFLSMGLQRAYTNGLTIWIEDKFLLEVIKFKLLGVPLLVIILFMVFIISYFAVYYTRTGFNLRIVGENKEAAHEV